MRVLAMLQPHTTTNTMRQWQKSHTSCTDCLHATFQWHLCTYANKTCYPQARTLSPPLTSTAPRSTVRL